MAKKPKYYVVWQGRQSGIFTDWKECEAQIKGFADARYKSFDTLAEAERAIQRNYWEFVTKKEQASPVSQSRPRPHRQADSGKYRGGCRLEHRLRRHGVPGRLSRQTGERIFLQGPFLDGTNNIGEFLAIVHGLAYLKENNSPLPHLYRFENGDGLDQKKTRQYQAGADTPQQALYLNCCNGPNAGWPTIPTPIKS